MAQEDASVVDLSAEDEGQGHQEEHADHLLYLGTQRQRAARPRPLTPTVEIEDDDEDSDGGNELEESVVTVSDDDEDSVGDMMDVDDPGGEDDIQTYMLHGLVAQDGDDPELQEAIRRSIIETKGRIEEPENKPERIGGAPKKGLRTVTLRRLALRQAFPEVAFKALERFRRTYERQLGERVENVPATEMVMAALKDAELEQDAEKCRQQAAKKANLIAEKARRREQYKMAKAEGDQKPSSMTGKARTKAKTDKAIGKRKRAVSATSAEDAELCSRRKRGEIDVAQVDSQPLGEAERAEDNDVVVVVAEGDGNCDPAKAEIRRMVAKCKASVAFEKRLAQVKPLDADSAGAGVLCNVCGDSFEPTDTTHCGAEKHSLCLPCLRQYFLTTLEGAGLANVSCCLAVSEKCQRTYHRAAFRAVLTPLELEKMEKNDETRDAQVAATAGGEGGTPFECRYCGSKAVVPRGVAGRPGTVECPNPRCGAVYCSMCGEEKGDPAKHRCLNTYGDLKDWVAKKSMKAVRRCPRCNAIIEKNGGCHHVRCFKTGAHGCGYYFCWVCGGPGTSCGAYECKGTGPWATNPASCT